MYSNRRIVTITETSGENRYDVIIQLSFTKDNFNFDTVKNNGLDIRFSLDSTVQNVLNMWVATWDVENSVGIIYITLPNIEANSKKKVFMHWGNDSDLGISDRDSIGFDFVDSFEDKSVTTTDKWDTVYTCTEGHITPTSWAPTASAPLQDKERWIIEMYMYHPSVSYNEEDTECAIKIDSGENLISCRWYYGDDYVRYINATGTYKYDTGSIVYGIESGSPSLISLGYDSTEDIVHQSASLRKTYDDYSSTWERKVAGNTYAGAFSVYCRSTHLFWVAARGYMYSKECTVDYSDLYIEYENVPQQIIDYTQYSQSLSSVNYNHYSNVLSDAYSISDDTNFLIESSTGDVDIAINFACKGTVLNNISYIHYDSGSEYGSRGSNLSSISGEWVPKSNDLIWAAIDFGSNKKAVNSLLIKGTSGSMPKNFKIEATKSKKHLSNPYIVWDVLYTGVLSDVSDYQLVYLNNSTDYKAYRIIVIDGYGETVKLKEWKMFQYEYGIKKKIISQLRLLPIELKEKFFPKTIDFLASNDGVTWDLLIDNSKTYTPINETVNGRWQPYSFTNNKLYWMYKIILKSNWGADGVGLSKWSLHEIEDEVSKFRVLNVDGAFDGVFVEDGFSFDNGEFYVVTSGSYNKIVDNELSSYNYIGEDIIDIIIGGL